MGRRFRQRCCKLQGRSRHALRRSRIWRRGSGFGPLLMNDRGHGHPGFAAASDRNRGRPAGEGAVLDRLVVGRGVVDRENLVTCRADRGLCGRSRPMHRGAAAEDPSGTKEDRGFRSWVRRGTLLSNLRRRPTVPCTNNGVGHPGVIRTGLMICRSVRCLAVEAPKRRITG